MTAPYAKPAGPDHLPEDTFVVFQMTSVLGHPDSIDVYHSRFFGCESDEHRNYLSRFGQGPHPLLEVTKNVYNLTPVFEYRTGLVVNRHVRDLLSLCCVCEFREVKITRAFWLPYKPGDYSFETAGVNMEGKPAQVMKRFAHEYACVPPEEIYYKVVAVAPYLFKDKFDDAQELRVGHDTPPESGSYGRDVLVSKAMIEKYGLVSGYLCRPDVFERLNPYLHRPWFWERRYAYPT